MVSRIIATLCAWLLSATLALAATPSTATVTGTLYSGSGSPLANATVIFNTPQQNVGGNTLGPTILSTRTNSSGVLTPITLVQSSVVQITINNGMVITGIVPASGSVDISQVLTGTAITGIGLQVNGVNVLSTSTINFENGSGITVSNPSAGNIQFALSGSGIVTSVGASFTGGLISVAGSPITSSGTLAFTVAGTSGGIPYFDSSTSWASSGALTANLPVIGGGAGVAPTVGTRSGNTTGYANFSGSTSSGKCLEWDANGNVVTAASNAACSAGGGTWVLAASNTSITGVDHVDFTSLSGYSEIMVFYRQVTFGSNDQCGVRVSSDNGSNFYSASGDYIFLPATGVESSTTGIFPQSAAATAARSGVVTIQQFNVASYHIAATPMRIDASANPITYISQTAAMNAVRVYSVSANNFTGGAIYVFGR